MQRSVKPLAVLATVIVTALLGYATFTTLHHVNQTTVTKTTPVATTPAPQPPTKAELLTLVNAERAKNGAAPLTESPLLDQSAQWKADDEVANNYFGHVKPGTTGNDGLDYLDSLKPPCTTVSENLVQNVDQNGKTFENTSQGSVSAWIGSPAHHAAMIDPKYTLTGFGIDGTQVVEHFCQP